MTFPSAMLDGSKLIDMGLRRVVTAIKKREPNIRHFACHICRAQVLAYYERALPRHRCENSKQVLRLVQGGLVAQRFEDLPVAFQVRLWRTHRCNGVSYHSDLRSINPMNWNANILMVRVCNSHYFYRRFSLALIIIAFLYIHLQTILLAGRFHVNVVNRCYMSNRSLLVSFYVSVYVSVCVSVCVSLWVSFCCACICPQYTIISFFTLMYITITPAHNKHTYFKR